MRTNNPYIFGDAVQGENFLDRQRELRRLVRRISQGGSVVISGEPRSGKTSLLLHLQSHAQALLGEEQADRTLFHYLDGHTMSGWDADRFWQACLDPLAKRWEVAARVYECGAFEATPWETVFAALEKEGQRFVLLLDEFDALQEEPGLHTRAVYGMLRSLASRYPSFSLVIAARRSLTELEYAAKDFAAGSPYFNFTEEINLPPLPQTAVEALLDRAKDRFTSQDRAFLQRVAGRHPYLLQVAAYYLWEWHEESQNAQERYQGASDEFLAVVESTLADIWRSWTPYMQMAFTLVALDNVPLLLGKRTFDLTALLKDLPDFSPELRKLERRGFLLPDSNLASGYIVHAEVMLWYLVEELTRTLRKEDTLQAWLERQEWQGLLKRSEQQAFENMFRQIRSLFGEGAKAFIRAAAEGAAKGLTARI